MAEKTGEIIPALQSRVRPLPHLLFHWKAFGRLSTDRQVGFSIGPVPHSAVDRYAERYGLDEPDEYERFLDLMRAMDRAFLEWHRKATGE